MQSLILLEVNTIPIVLDYHWRLGWFKPMELATASPTDSMGN
jgi:hypothetical protein